MADPRPPRHRVVAVPNPPSGHVFENPAGIRWRRIRRVALLLALVLATLVGITGAHVLAPPALDGPAVPEAPTVDEIGAPPVLGSGPLVRLVRLVPTDDAVYAQDPFTAEVVEKLPKAQVAEAGDAPYALQRYGYETTQGRTISLTFDDGPDPVWTPRLLDLLSRNGVPATFFVTGQQMARNPDILRRMAREGFAVGNHSLTHTDVNLAASFRQRAEMVIPDRIQRALTGTYAGYFRLPYEGDDEESMQGDVPGILRAQQLGYVVASHDFDTSDWAYAAGLKHGQIPMPPLGRQQHLTVLMHDAGGGDRSKTLAYVQRLIDAARAEGYRFTTMPQAQPAIAERTGHVEVTIWDRVALKATEALFVLPSDLLFLLFVLAIASMLGLGLLNTALALFRAWLVRRRTARRGSWLAPGVSVLIAAYNEERVIARTLAQVLASDFPLREVVVIDDGSIDGTSDAVRAVAARDERVRLVRTTNGGKWAALNRGMLEVREAVVVTLDADTVVEPDAITHLVARFHDPRIAAVAGVVKVGNHSRNLITRWQALEYLTQIVIDRAAAALVNGVSVVPGAFAAWRRAAVLQAGGYSGVTLAEDCDLTLLLHQYGWRIEQADDAVAWTEAPETVDALLKQRSRWMFGTFQALWRHRNMLLRPRYGWLGTVTLPITLLTLLVPIVFTPMVTILLVQTLVDEGVLALLVYLGLFALVHLVSAAVAVALLRERPVHLLVVPIYRLIHEPLRAYLLYASAGAALRGVRMGWNKLARTAHLDVSPAPAPPVRVRGVVAPPGPLVPEPAPPVRVEDERSPAGLAEVPA
jgi:peptidoglycan-N-acetylglucosamine deacetylase